MAVVESPVTSLLPYVFLRRETLVTPSIEPEPAAVRPSLRPHDLLIFKARRIKQSFGKTNAMAHYP